MLSPFPAVRLRIPNPLILVQNRFHIIDRIDGELAVIQIVKPDDLLETGISRQDNRVH